MRPEDLVFWLDVRAVDDDGRNVLCRRHADTMVVPRGWTLDDLRDPDLHLFRPPTPSAAVGARRRRSLSSGRPSVGVSGEQLSLDDDGETAIHDSEPPPPAAPWTPSFDHADDLGGLLAAHSPLLARAFTGADRPRAT